jgi:hypothetical protein
MIRASTQIYFDVGLYSKSFEAYEDIFKGCLVVTNINGRILKATTNCIGIATQEILTGFAGNVQYQGIVNLDDWTDSIGAADLSINQDYYLDTDGTMTNVPPSSGYSQYIGRAVSLRELELNIKYSIKL